MFLIVGGDSEIGAATYRAMRSAGVAVAATTRRRNEVAPGRLFLDLAAPLDEWEPPRETTAVCICAALARLAACAADPIGTDRINVVQTVALAERLLARGIYVLFLSTNQVFDGARPMVAPDAPHSPVSEYGRQKARTEAVLQAAMARGAPAAILRLAKVVSLKMPLIEGWIAELSAHRPIRAFCDTPLAPTPTALVSAAIGSLLADRASGTFQLTGPRDASYAALGRFLAARLGVAASLVVETSARDAGLPEGATPLHTTLDSSLLLKRYGHDVPDIWEVIDSIAAHAGPRR